VAFTVVADIVVPKDITVYNNKIWYVASASDGGDNGNAGTTKDAPLATVQKALEEIAGAYALDAPWQGTPDAYAAIVILNTVTVESQITIDNTNSEYPPILLTNALTTGGKLQATAGIGDGNNLLSVTNAASVTLAGRLILEGIDNGTDKIGGVYIKINVNGDFRPVFTMKGGTITRFNHRGVVVYGSFIMEDGEISYNTSTSTGGGVFVGDSNSDTFTMKGGKISYNTSMHGGGVYIHAHAWGGGIFTMEGGEISDNNTSNTGGGVYVGGRVVNSGSGNTVYGSATFIMKGGDIINNATSGGGGGVYLYEPCAKFSKTGGTINNNESKAGFGDQVYYFSPYLTDSPVGPEYEMRVNYPNRGDAIYPTSWL
jgi:hypothetical protein